MEILQILSSTAALGPWAVPAVAFGYGVYKSVDCAIEYLRNKKDANVPQTICKVSSIYDQLSHLLTSTPATAVRIMALSNGGSIPRVGVPLYLSTVYEVYSARNQPIRKSYDKTPADKFAILEAHRLVEHKSNDGMIITSIPEDSDILRHNSIIQLEWFQIHQEEGMYIFLQLEYPEPVPTNAAHHSLTQESITQIRKAFVR